MQYSSDSQEKPKHPLAEPTSLISDYILPVTTQSHLKI
jgi:hypothetical protein